MTLKELTRYYMQVKEVKPQNANELLDFVQRSYIHDQLSIVEYRNLYRELTDQGAEKPKPTVLG